MIEFNHAKNASPAFLSGVVPPLALPEQYDDMASLPKAICELENTGRCQFPVSCEMKLPLREIHQYLRHETHELPSSELVK